MNGRLRLAAIVAALMVFGAGCQEQQRPLVVVTSGGTFERALGDTSISLSRSEPQSASRQSAQAWGRSGPASRPCGRPEASNGMW